MKTRRLLAGPYLFWAVSFIIIPLLLIVYYGLTDTDGAFTLLNLAKMAEPENLKSLGLALLLFPGKHTDLPDTRLPSCHDSLRKKPEPDKLHCTYFYSSHVG